LKRLPARGCFRPGRGSVACGTILLALAILLASAGAEATVAPGRLLSASGVAYGGIVEFNHDGSNLVNLTSNTFGQMTNNPDGQYKSDYASVARNGKTAFASSRGGQGWRIYVMNANGSDVRELTKPTSAAGIYSNDIDPVISPDGSRIAFASNRAGVARQPQMTGLIDLYMVNVNGTGLRQVTKSEVSSHEVGSSVRGLVWSPNGKQIAFRGARIAPEASGGPADLQDVLGFISSTGQGEVDDVVGDCADAGALDWSGGRIVYTFGGSVQGCPATTFVVRDVASGASSTIPAAQLGNLPSTGAGSVRLSPDGTQIVYTEIQGTKTDLVTITSSGSGRQAIPVPIDFGAWLWWTPGPAVPKPARFVLSPAKITLHRGGKSVQVHATVLDAGGHVISDSAADWTMDGLNAGSPTCGTTGLLKAASTASPQTTMLHATNAGLSAVTSVTVT
jgi:WD40-like Beta Propeller Repeat